MLLTANSAVSARDALAFSPTFTDTMTFSDAIKTACNNVLSCMIDASLTGVTQIGGSTSSSVQAQKQAIKVASNLKFPLTKKKKKIK